MTVEEKEIICNLYDHDCECCPYEIDQIDENGNIILDCSFDCTHDEEQNHV